MTRDTIFWQFWMMFRISLSLSNYGSDPGYRLTPRRIVENLRYLVQFLNLEMRTD